MPQLLKLISTTRNYHVNTTMRANITWNSFRLKFVAQELIIEHRAWDTGIAQWVHFTIHLKYDHGINVVVVQQYVYYLHVILFSHLRNVNLHSPFSTLSCLWMIHPATYYRAFSPSDHRSTHNSTQTKYRLAEELTYRLNKVSQKHLKTRQNIE